MTVSLVSRATQGWGPPPWSADQKQTLRVVMQLVVE